MASQEEESAPKPQVVANAFVQEYYYCLSQSPEFVHKFYQDTSVISRPDSDGLMSSETTLNGIDKMILSLDSKNCVVQILAADAQESLGNGVIVLVTGFYTGKDDIRRKFTQVFCLAPQGDEHIHTYFVLNDVFRYVDKEGSPTMKISDADEAAPTAPLTPDPELSLVSNHPVLDTATIPLEELPNQDEESSYPLDNGKISTAEKEAGANLSDSQKDARPVSVASSQNDALPISVAPSQNDAHPISVASSESDAQPVSEDAFSNVQENAPKKSYASIANALNFKKEPFQHKVAPAKPVEKPLSSMVAKAAPLQASNSAVEKNNNHAVKGYSIFVANLPMNASEEQLRETFQRFGPIKSNGVRVRTYQQEKNCFGFVEFESEDSMRKALEVSFIMIGNQRAHIEEKKGNNDGGKYPSRRGGFRNDNFRTRGNFGGGRGYGRNEFENRGGFSSSHRGTGGRNGETSRKVHQNEGDGRVAGQSQTQSGNN